MLAILSVLLKNKINPSVSLLVRLCYRQLWLIIWEIHIQHPELMPEEFRFFI